MHDASADLSSNEEAAEQARGDLADALAKLQDRLTPAHILGDIGHSARSAAAPLIDPLIAQTRSSAGLIGLAGTAAAIVYGLGRANGSRQHTEKPAARKDGLGVMSEASDDAPAAAQPRQSTPLRARQKIKALLLAAGALAAGSAIGASLPLTRAEKQFGEGPGRDLRRRARKLARDHSGEIMSGAVNAFGVAKGIGGLIGLLALAASQLNKKSSGSAAERTAAE